MVFLKINFTLSKKKITKRLLDYLYNRLFLQHNFQQLFQKMQHNQTSPK